MSETTIHPDHLVLQVRSVMVAFGGLLALRGIDLDVARGDRLAIIGPNGAGKSTLFNVISGDITPTQGTVAIKGQDCTALPSRYRPRLGVARTYQQARTFAGLTVLENLFLGVAGPRRRHRALWRSATDRAMQDEAARAAETVWLSGYLNTRAGDLAHGQKRQLELGMAVVSSPDVLLLDEPASGLSRGERERLVELLDSLPEEITLLLIEHDMDIAFRLARTVAVMANGHTIASGPPAAIQADPTVHEVYLGTEATT